MIDLNGFLQSASVSVAGIAVASLWQGFLMGAFAWVCLKLTPRLSASARFSFWFTVFAANLLLPILSLTHRSAAVVPASVAAPTHPVLHLDSRWALAIAAVWLLSAATRAIGLIRNALRVRALCKSSTPAGLNASLQPLLQRTASARASSIHSSTQVDQPCVIGFFRPRILVPEWLLTKATATELRQIVLHEASHLRRWDDWTNLAQKLALVVFPLNPALWWIERQLCSAREEACDERVVRETRSPREYAACLANLAAERMARRMGRATALSLGAWEHRSALAGRIHSILRSGSRLGPAKARAVMAAFVIATVGGAVELSGTSRLVAFASPEAPASELAQQAAAGAPPAAAYHDVVFRQPTSGQHGPELIAGNAVLPSRQTGKRRQRPLAAAFGKNPARPEQSSLRRVTFSVDQPQSWVVVTRWETLSGRQAPVVVVQGVVHFSSSADPDAANGLAAIPTQSGWFVFQL